MFVSLNFAWPQQLHQLYAAMSVFNLNIQITAPEVRLTATVWPARCSAPHLCFVGDASQKHGFGCSCPLSL